MPLPTSDTHLMTDLASLLRDVLTALQSSHDTRPVSALLKELTLIREAMEAQVAQLHQTLPSIDQQAQILAHQNHIQTQLNSMTRDIASISQILQAPAFPEDS